MFPADFSRRHKGIAAFQKIFFLALGAFFLGTCGLEDYPYIEPIPEEKITRNFNYSASVEIPGSNTSAFTNFVIFYRIYLGRDPEESSPGAGNFNSINSYLNSDYTFFSNYIGSDTQVNTNMDALFTSTGTGGKNHKYLSLEGYNIDNVLSSGVLGKTLEFNFSSTNGYPTMTIGSNVYTLSRTSDRNSINELQPSRYFVSGSDLWRSDYINDLNINTDVENRGITGDPQLAYAAMYIVAVGIDDTNYSTIYSTPSLIHVFLLPPTFLP